jgi:hypothetical protein
MKQNYCFALLLVYFLWSKTFWLLTFRIHKELQLLSPLCDSPTGQKVIKMLEQMKYMHFKPYMHILESIMLIRKFQYQLDLIRSIKLIHALMNGRDKNNVRSGKQMFTPDD